MTTDKELQSAAYYNSRPRKATGAGILIFNQNDEVLIVKPNYLDRWLWVGGGIEEDEAPMAAAIRECQEEIGVTFKESELKLAFVHYMSQKPNGQKEGIQFVFVVPPVANDFIETLRLGEDEIEDAKFVAVDDLVNYVSSHRASAVKAYMDNRSKGDGLYFENGRLAGGYPDVT